MITLGRIESIAVDTNLCCVDVPIFNKTSSDQTKLHATMMLQPGIYGGYEVGDIVFVAFTDNTLGRPIVLGRLYQGSSRQTVSIDSFVGMKEDKDASSRASQFDCARLNVSERVTLPADISFGVGSALQNYNTLGKLLDKVIALEAEVETLKAEVDKLKPKSFLEAVVDTVTGNN